MLIDLIAEKRPTPSEASAAARLFAGKLAGADLFRRLVIVCMPARACAGDCRSASRYLSFIALVYRLAPETFKGRAAAEIARRAGAEVQAFEAELAEADKLLARPGKVATVRPNSARSRVLPRHPASRGSARGLGVAV